MPDPLSLDAERAQTYHLSPECEGPRCHAPHPDPRKAGNPCNWFLGRVPFVLRFVTTAEHAPEGPSLDLWLPCGRDNCGKVNRFRVVPP